MQISNSPILPSKQLAQDVLERALGIRGSIVQPSPHSQSLYEVTPTNGSKLEIFFASGDAREQLKRSVYWSEKLAPLGVPLPKVLSADLSARLPYVIREPLPGARLMDAYPALTIPQRQAVAYQVAAIQSSVQQLPMAHGFGSLASYRDREPARSWYRFIENRLETARTAALASNAVTSSLVSKIDRALAPLSGYIHSILPIPFLDEKTTQNILIHDGSVCGIADVQSVWFGDPVYVLAQARLSFFTARLGSDYVNAWASAWKLSDLHVSAFRLYTAIESLGYIAEHRDDLTSKMRQGEQSPAERVRRLLRSFV